MLGISDHPRPCHDAVVLAAWIVVDCSDETRLLSLLGPGRLRLIDLDLGVVVDLTGPSGTCRDAWQASAWWPWPAEGTAPADADLARLAAAAVAATDPPESAFEVTPETDGTFPEDVLGPLYRWLDSPWRTDHAPCADPGCPYCRADDVDAVLAPGEVQ